MRKKRHHSIRDRLYYSFFLTTGLMCIVVLYSFISTNSIAISLSNAYITNIILNDYQQALSESETSLGQYVSLRTFESLEGYYAARAKIDDLSLNFNNSVSAHPVLLLEYKIKNLIKTFFEYADITVYARRANNVLEYNTNHRKALTVYRYLLDSLDELNGLYFQQNISGYGQIFNDMKKIEVISGIILILVISVNFLMVYLLINKITNPLVHLSKAAERLASGDYSVSLAENHTNDELGNIYRAFDRMTISIRDQIETIKTNALIESSLRQRELEIRELYKDAQLKNLQAQINPHFLFNTLNAGAQLAMMEGADDTCAFIEKTADFFRYNIQKLDKGTTLLEEIELVDNYMYIMKVRYGDTITYIKDIQSENLNLAMPSMILQPLVENSVKHGISSNTKKGVISLKVFETKNALVIEISDNGPGFTPETRDNLLRGSYFSEGNSKTMQSKPSVGIGMINVITRLRLFFEDDTIFNIRNNEDSGATFSIRIKHV